MFAYPLPSIPTHVQPILIENQSNPIGIDPQPEFSLRFYPTNDINAQDPYILWISIDSSDICENHGSHQGNSRSGKPSCYACDERKEKGRIGVGGIILHGGGVAKIIPMSNP